MRSRTAALFTIGRLLCVAQCARVAENAFRPDAPLDRGADVVSPPGVVASPSVLLQRSPSLGSVRDLIGSGDIVAFVTEDCPFCHRALGALQEAGYTAKVVHAPRGSPIRAELAELTESTSVPKVWVKGQFVGGCNDGGLGGVLPLLKSGQIQRWMDDV